jgi:hypothetical protein
MTPSWLASNSNAVALPGTWKLASGRAVTLNPREPGRLKVLHGSVWATFEGPHGARPDSSGDIVIEQGQRLSVRAGERVVIEPLNRDAAAYFSWEPLQ